ncbi:AAA family ATPase [Salinarimonas chemoclinalis]|uniref:AAA family ATPase n=1 Tax=Salinarimonas chemoclinalis TaxID=3241599 RepID=UPI003557ED9A
MLTRIEIDGFKSFSNLKLDLQPFTVIAGPNASGKSNFFDALRFLSQLVSTDLAEALRRVRGDPSELFRREADGTSAAFMRFAVEVLLEPEIVDAFGERRLLKHTRLRYEVEIEKRTEAPGGVERLFVRREGAWPIMRKDDEWLTGDPRPSKTFVKAHALYSSGGGRSPFLETLGDKFQANQDGTQGRPRPFSKERATATVLSRITVGSEFPHLFALRRELESLTFLQLEAAAEREPSDALDADELKPDGSNLARVLARIESETRTAERPHGDLSDIRNQLGLLIPGVRDITIEQDTFAGRYRLFVSMRDQATFSSRVLSDGTLRVLALLTFLNDHRRKSVLLFEEPENGIHEERLMQLVQLLREATTDVTSDGTEERLFQTIVNTHSPIVLANTEDWELVLVDVVSVIDPSTGRVSRRSRMQTGIKDQAEMQLSDRETTLSRMEADRVLRRGSEHAA